MHNVKKICFAITAIFFTSFCFGQQLFYSTIVNGGVTANGIAPGSAARSIDFPVLIPTGSAIEKAFLFAVRDSTAPDVEITLNGVAYTFSIDDNVISNTFNSFTGSTGFSLRNSAIHAIDITNDISPSTNSYNITTPEQSDLYRNYPIFYLYIVYKNQSLNKISCNFYINTQDVATVTNYLLELPSPIDNSEPVCFGTVVSIFCSKNIDGSYITINNDSIGLLGGPDSNSGTQCYGPFANFSHSNNTITGLDDDTSDNYVDGSDALANIQNNVSDGDTYTDIKYSYHSPTMAGKLTNPIKAIMLSYSTPCDTFNTSAIEITDTICAGDSVQLWATGGVTYKWWGAFGGISDTLSDMPMAVPEQTSTYIVQITNAQGCSKTEHVKVWVHPRPVVDAINTHAPDCGSSNGSITAAASNGTPPYSYLWSNNSIVPTTQNLAPNTYLVTVTDIYGCADILSIDLDSTTIRQQAQLTPTPDNGTAPLWVVFENTSTNMSDYIWAINGDTLTEFEPNYTFDTAGIYQITLTAYNYVIACADTAYATVIVDSLTTAFITVPSVFSPNGDGVNDNFTIVSSGVSAIEIAIFNRWGTLVFGSQFLVDTSAIPSTKNQLWDGRTAAGVENPEGTYFYTITYTINDTNYTKQGSITLVR